MKEMRIRAEHESLKGYLESALTANELSRPLLTNFNHWIFAQGALTEVALTLHDRGSEVTIGFWADKTPMLDVAWETSRTIGTMLFSPTREQQIHKALLRAGFPKSAFPKPPISHWRPEEKIRIPDIPNRSNIRAMNYRGADMGRAILQVHPDRNTPITDQHQWPTNWVEKAAVSFAYVFDQTFQLIEQRNCTMLSVYNGRFLHDRAAAAAAEAQGIPVVSYDLGGLDTDFDLTIDDTHDWDALQGRMISLYERWDPSERDEIGSSWFLDRRAHRDPMNALFVEAQKIGSMIDLPRDKKIVVFFSSSGDEIVELDLDWKDFFGSQENALKLVAEVCRQDPNVFLVVRSHPHKRHKPQHDVQEWLASVDAAAPDIHLDPHSDVDSYELMRAADLVVTYGSTSGVEAAFARRPVVVMGPSAYNILGCATQVRTRTELERAIAHPQAGDWNRAVSYGLLMKRRGFRYSQIATTDGGKFQVNGIEIRESSELIRKVSHLYRRIVTKRKYS